MENVKVRDRKKHPLENSKVVCLLVTNALPFKGMAVK